MQANAFVFEQPRNLADVLSGTFTFIKQEFKLLTKTLLFIAGPFIVGGVLLLNNKNVALVGSFINLNGVSGYTTTELIKFFSGLFMLILAQLVIVTTVYSYIALYVKKGSGNFEFTDIYRFTTKKVGKVFWAVLITSILTGFGFLLVIPGIYFVFCFLLVIPEAVLSPLSIGNSIKRSFHLIRNYWWQTVGILVLLGIVLIFARLIFNIPLSILTFFNLAQSDGSNMNVLMRILFLILNIFSNIGTYLLSAVPYIAIGLQYFSLIEIKEAPALAKKVNAININPINENIN